MFTRKLVGALAVLALATACSSGGSSTSAPKISAAGPDDRPVKKGKKPVKSARPITTRTVKPATGVLRKPATAAMKKPVTAAIKKPTTAAIKKPVAAPVSRVADLPGSLVHRDSDACRRLYRRRVSEPRRGRRSDAGR